MCLFKKMLVNSFDLFFKYITSIQLFTWKQKSLWSVAWHDFWLTVNTITLLQPKTSLRPSEFTKYSTKQDGRSRAKPSQHSYITTVKNPEVFHCMSGCSASSGLQHPYPWFIEGQNAMLLVKNCRVCIYLWSQLENCWGLRKLPSGSNSHHGNYVLSSQAITVMDIKAEPVTEKIMFPSDKTRLLSKH